MANEYVIAIDIAARPDAVWEILGDPCGVPRWYRLYVGCEVEGDVRRLSRSDGVELVERLLDRDEARRYYAYEILSGAPLRSHWASFEVQDSGDGGSRVLWHTRAEPVDPAGDVEARLGPRQVEALRVLKGMLED